MHRVKYPWYSLTARTRWPNFKFNQPTIDSRRRHWYRLHIA